MDIKSNGVSWNPKYVSSYSTEKKFVDAKIGIYYQNLEEDARKAILAEVYSLAKPKKEKKPATKKAKE